MTSYELIEIDDRLGSHDRVGSHFSSPFQEIWIGYMMDTDATKRTPLTRICPWGFGHGVCHFKASFRPHRGRRTVERNP